MSPESSAKSKKPQENAGKEILTALSQQEVALWLEALWASLPAESREIALNRMPRDTRETLQQLLREYQDPKVKTKTKTVSLAKREQIWSDLWGEWDKIVWSATEEEGKYIEQEEHWEPPYFDDSTFTEDLETLAKQMLPLLSNAYEHEFLPKAEFTTVLEEMAEEISGSLPEWIRLVNEGFYLGSYLTTCLLKWQWLKAEEEGIDAFGLIQGIREWEERVKQVNLEQSALFNFLTQLADADLEKIYEGLTAQREELRWKKPLKNIHSHWYEIYLYCLERYAPERRLSSLRGTIEQEWQHGLPVIKDLLEKEAYQESLTVIESTLQSWRKSNYCQGDWAPENELLVTMAGGFSQRDSSSAEVTLLGYYQQAAEGLNQSERVKALALQLTAYEHRFNWSVMLAAFRQEELSQSTSRKLWQSWRDDIIRRLERNYYSGEESRAESSWWLPWLLDRVSESPHHQRSEEFPSRIKQWLADVPKKEKPSKQDFLALRLLTNDLGEIRQEKWHQYPHFLAVVLKPASLKTPDSESRQSFLQQLAPQDLWKSLMAYWQSHLDSWIPQPETAYKSDYSEQAKWVAAWRELSPTAYQNLLGQWRVQHKKRRNLWKALADMGLS